MTNAYNYRPCGTPMQSARGVRSTIEGEIFKGTDGACADPNPRIFPATGLRSNTAFQSNPISFHVTHRFFGTFLDSKKVP